MSTLQACNSLQPSYCGSGVGSLASVGGTDLLQGCLASSDTSRQQRPSDRSCGQPRRLSTRITHCANLAVGIRQDRVGAGHPSCLFSAFVRPAGCLQPGPWDGQLRQPPCVSLGLLRPLPGPLRGALRGSVGKVESRQSLPGLPLPGPLTRPRQGLEEPQAAARRLPGLTIQWTILGTQSQAGQRRRAGTPCLSAKPPRHTLIPATFPSGPASSQACRAPVPMLAFR